MTSPIYKPPTSLSDADRIVSAWKMSERDNPNNPDPRNASGPLRSYAEMRARLESIEADERLHCPLAGVHDDRLLALSQVELSAQSDVLRWALGLPPRVWPAR